MSSWITLGALVGVACFYIAMAVMSVIVYMSAEGTSKNVCMGFLGFAVAGLFYTGVQIYNVRQEDIAEKKLQDI